MSSFRVQLEIHGPTYKGKKDGWIKISPQYEVPPVVYSYTLDGGSSIPCTNVIMNVEEGTYVITATSADSQTVSPETVITANEAPEFTQQEIDFFNLKACGYRMMLKYLNAKKIGDTGLCCLWRKAFRMQALIRIMSNNYRAQLLQENGFYILQENNGGILL